MAVINKYLNGCSGMKCDVRNVIKVRGENKGNPRAIYIFKEVNLGNIPPNLRCASANDVKNKALFIPNRCHVLVGVFMVLIFGNDFYTGSKLDRGVLEIDLQKETIFLLI